MGTHSGTDHVNRTLARLADLAFGRRGHMLAGWAVLKDRLPRADAIGPEAAASSWEE
jgi:hypothetical protein